MQDSLISLETFFCIFCTIKLLIIANKLLNLDNFGKEMMNHHTSILLYDEILFIKR